MDIPRWKLIAGGAALAGIVAGGVARADDSLDLNDRRPAITLADPVDLGPTVLIDDGSPESADSPNESVEESADSPFDSPDDPGWVDPSPESADSPDESAEDSPPPAPAPAPAPAADSYDSPAAPVSWDSPGNAD